MPLFSRFLAIRRGESPIDGGHSSPQLPHYLPTPSRPGVKSSLTPDLDEASLPQRYGQLAQGLRSSLPSTCRWLGPEDINLVGGHPIAAGGFADIYEATHDGLKVVLKSYRCYELFDVAQIVAMFHNEVHVWTLLRHGGADVVSLIGVYSTEAHPFGLVYEYMNGLDLRQYIKTEPSLRRLELLIGIARGLKHIHDLGVVHGNLQSANILVDKDGTARIAGLSNAYVLSHSTIRAAKDRANTGKLSRGHAPELNWPGASPDMVDPMHPTKASDMYGFGVVAWEVLTGRQPFSEMTEIAATYSMLNGSRPPRPNHHEISDRLWHIVELCWHNVPLKRMPVGEVVQLLEKELGCTPGSSAISCAK